MRIGYSGKKGWINGLTMAAVYTIKIFGIGIFGYLVYHMLRYTWYIMPGGGEIPTQMQDSVWKNIFGSFLFMVYLAGWFYLEKKIPVRFRRLICGILIGTSVLWVGSAGLCWINAAVHRPVGDCAFVYGGASYFLEGQYSFLEPPGGYCAMYPHQLGLIALTELLFLVAGTYNFYAFQLMCVFFSMGIVLAGYLVLSELVSDMAVKAAYCAVMSCCVPLIFYTSWVYGDIPSIFFSLMAIWMLFRYKKCGRSNWLIGMVLMVTMALLNRKNCMILVIALCLVVLVSMLKKQDWKLFLAMVMCVLLPWLAYMGIYKMYEVRSGYVGHGGLPVITWVDMGLHDVNGVCGWYDNSAKELYYATESDLELTAVLSKQRVAERLEGLWQFPEYGRDFFKKKILSQWNMPLYQSVYFNTMYTKESMPEAESVVAGIAGEGFWNVLSFCDRLQFIVFLGFWAYFIWGIRKDSEILYQITAVMVIGGFLFSVIWEAKARYIFPYYIMMFPFAVVGYLRMMQALKGLGRRISHCACLSGRSRV